MKKFVTIFSVIFILANICPASQEDFDVTYYEINISIDPDSEIVSGYVTVRAKSEIDGLTTMILDLYDNMTVDSISGNISSFIHHNNQIEITLDKTYNVDEEVEETIYYYGHPDAQVSYANPMVFKKIGGNTIICTESCPYYARCWWPCKDTPADKPDSVDIKVTVPEDLIVASNGVRVGIFDNNDHTQMHHWHIKNPIATYLITITIFNYSEFSDVYEGANNDSMELMYFVFPNDSAKAARQFKKVPQMIDILTQYYGQYPYLNEKYGMAEYMGDWAAMEYQTLSCFGPSYIADEETILHELSHQWWGDCVTPKDFHHTWISEGFATFSEAIYKGELRGSQQYHNHMNSLSWAYNETDTLYQHDISTPNEVYPIIVYHKGAWVLHMLRHVVGDSMFWDCLREYRQRYEYSSATTEDFQAVCEEIYGESLEWFFHQWVYEPSFPKYNCGWWQEEKNGGQYKVSGFIDRVRTNFKMPLDVTLKTAEFESTNVVWVNDSTAVFDFIVNQQVTDVQLDKDNWVLKNWSKVTTPLIKYHNHEVNDSTGNNNGLSEPGENVTLWVSLINRGVPANEISVTLSKNDPSIQITQANAEIANLTHNQTESSPFNIYISPEAKGHMTVLYLTISTTDGYSTRDSLYVKIGNPNILLVDDDNGADYEQYFYDPLIFAKAYSATWEVASRGCPTVLNDYSAVIWLTGDDRTTSLTTEEQQALTEYLDSGGRLFITGQNIGYDLVEDGTAEDSSFYANYLHAKYVADSTEATIIMWIAGDVITNGIFFYLGGAGNQTAPSIIEAIDDAQLIFNWVPGYVGAGLRYADPIANYRLVYLAFGLEGVDEPVPQVRNKLMANILDWFAIGTKLNFTDPITGLPQNFQLYQNYPNPFNNNTTIEYQLPVAEHVDIEVFNLLGQRIRRLVSKYQEPGWYNIAWKGDDRSGSIIASGIYVYRMRAGDFVKTKKLLLLK